MEGPSLKITVEQFSPFINKVVNAVEGNTKENKDLLVGQKVTDIFSWGKHFLIQFDDYALKVHFLLWGSYRADVNGKSVTGEYYRDGNKKNPRLTLQFDIGEICFYNCSVKITEDKNIKSSYDFSVDILEPEWDRKQAIAKIKEHPDEIIADVLLDQDIFSGVGNIIKNEVLFRQKINPKTLIKDLSNKKLDQIIAETELFSHQFYEWRKKFELKKHFGIYKKSTCPNCGSSIIKENLGKKKRRTFYCSVCQP